jgi:hypothetical protein
MKVMPWNNSNIRKIIIETTMKIGGRSSGFKGTSSATAFCA